MYKFIITFNTESKILYNWNAASEVTYFSGQFASLIDKNFKIFQ